MELVGQNRKHCAAEHFSRTAIQLRQSLRIWQPGTRRNVLLRLVIGLCPTVALVIFLSIVASRAGAPSLRLEIDPYLLPGRPLPRSASCGSGDPGFRSILNCKVFQEGGGLVRLTYDRRTQVTRSASFAVDGVTIGDLILAWGTPNSYRHDYGTIRIYWDGKSAWLSAPLNPTSQVRSLLFYSDESDLPQDRPAWRGFVTVDRVNSLRK